MSERDEILRKYIKPEEFKQIQKSKLYGVKNAVYAKARRRRNSEIYVRFWQMRLKSDYKIEACHKDLAERFGLSSPKYIENIIETFDKDPSKLLVDGKNTLELMKQVDLPKLYTSVFETAAKIEGQIADLETLKECGDEWYEEKQEVSRGTTAKGEFEGDKTQKIRIDDRILQLQKDKTKVYNDWYRLLAELSPAKKELEVTKKFTFDPSKALMEIIEQNNKQVEAEFEVME